MKKLFLLAVSHGVCLAFGFALGIYLLPILTAPEAPAMAQIEAVEREARYRAAFRRDLAGSDAFHWGEGELSITGKQVALHGEVAPGPDYKLYLAPRFVETEAEFLAVKEQSLRIGEVKTFENFLVEVPDGVDLEEFTTVVVWCEAFGEFISAAQYR